MSHTQYTIVISSHKYSTSVLPFPLFSNQWYKEQARLAKARKIRTNLRVSFRTEYKEGKIMAV